MLEALSSSMQRRTRPRFGDAARKRWDRGSSQPSAARLARCVGLCLGLLTLDGLAQTTPPRATSANRGPEHPTPAEITSSNQTPPMTEPAALSQLRRENLTLMAARQELDAARADVIAAGLLPNPRLSVGGAWVMHGVPSGGMQEYQIGAEQELPLAGQPRARRDAAQAAATVAEHEYAALVWEAVYRMRTAYLELGLAQARERLVAQALEDLTTVEGVIEARARAGANPMYDQLRLSIERARRIASATDATSAVASARTVLAQAIGPSVDAQNLAVAGDPGEPKAELRSAKELIRQALGRRPEVLAARLQVTAKEQKTRAITKQYIPSPELSLGYARWSNVPTERGDRLGGAFVAGLSLPVPIFNYGQGTIDRSRAETLAASSRRTLAESTVRRQIEQAEHELRLRLDAWQAFRAHTPEEADRMRSTAEIAYREGRATILELLDAYNSRLATQELGLTLRGQALRAALTLEWALGPQAGD